MLILFGSVTSGENLNKVSIIQIKNIDKIIHFVFYFSLTLSLLGSLFKNSLLSTKKQIFLAIIISLCYGLLMEFLQYYFTETRMAELLDIISNTLGCLFGLLFFINLKNTKLIRLL